MSGYRFDRLKTLVVDDNAHMRKLVVTILQSFGCAQIQEAESGERAWSVLRDFNPDVIVLDWSMPAMSGIELLPRLRREGIRLPVVFLTGRSAHSHEHLAFDRGAVDFVDKSRGVPILAKRIHAIVKSSRRPPELEVDETQHCGRLMLKPRVSRAFWDAIDVNLTVSEFNVVRLLASNAGKHVTYRAIHDCIHGAGFIAGSGEHGYRINVRSSIKRIRNKFRLVDPEFAETENYASFGYCWRRPDRAIP